jgi:phage gp36-like protein
VATYATLAQLAAGAPPGSIQDIDDPTKQAALDAFSDEMDGYFRAQETLPLDEPYPLAVVRHCVAGTVWQLMCFKGFNPEIASNMVFEKNYDRAIAWLKSIARGEVSLAVEADASTTRLGGARVSTQPRRGW